MYLLILLFPFNFFFVLYILILVILYSLKYGYLPKQIELLPEIRMMILQLDLGVLEGATYNITAAPYQIGCWGCPNGSAGALYWGDQGQHIERTNAVTTNTDTFLINMQYIPVIKVERGKWYLMRMVLASVSEGITFRVPDGCDLELLAKDGIYLDEAPRSVDAIFLLPGSRADVAIRCDLEERAYSMDIISTVRIKYKQLPCQSSILSLCNPINNKFVPSTMLTT